MLRELIAHSGKAADATYKAKTEMKTGMGVVKGENGVAAFPEAASAQNIYWVQKARIPVGINASRVNQSDYDTDFVNVAKDELVVLVNYSAGEKFATDAVGTVTKSDAGKVVEVNTDGTLVVATGPSIYLYRGEYLDAGNHVLAEIEVLDTAISNE